MEEPNELRRDAFRGGQGREVEQINDDGATFGLCALLWLAILIGCALKLLLS